MNNANSFFFCILFLIFCCSCESGDNDKETSIVSEPSEPSEPLMIIKPVKPGASKKLDLSLPAAPLYTPQKDDISNNINQNHIDYVLDKKTEKKYKYSGDIYLKENEEDNENNFINKIDGGSIDLEIKIE